MRVLLPALAAMGLAVQGQGQGEAAADWTARIVEFAPALRGCLSAAGPAAFVTGAVPRPGGLEVTLRAGGATRRCIAAPGAAPRHEVLSGAAPPDPAGPAFFLERRCVDARRVDAPDGTVLGWLAYPGC